MERHGPARRLAALARHGRLGIEQPQLGADAAHESADRATLWQHGIQQRGEDNVAVAAADARLMQAAQCGQTQPVRPAAAPPLLVPIDVNLAHSLGASPCAAPDALACASPHRILSVRAEEANSISGSWRTTTLDFSQSAMAGASP